MLQRDLNNSSLASSKSGPYITSFDQMLGSTISDYSPTQHYITAPPYGRFDLPN